MKRLNRPGARFLTVIPVSLYLFIIWMSSAVYAAEKIQPPSITWFNPTIDLKSEKSFQDWYSSQRCHIQLCKPIIQAIKQAKTSIKFATYGLRNQPELLQSLIEAEQRGVKVKGIIESDIHGNNYYKDSILLFHSLQNIKTDCEVDRKKALSMKPNVPHKAHGLCQELVQKSVKRSQNYHWYDGDLLHHKFIIIDNKSVITGSANWSSSGIGGYHYNNQIKSNNSDSVQRYIQEFSRMYDFNFAGRPSNKKQLEKILTLKPEQWEVIFSPDKKITKSLVSLLDKAQNSINLALYYFTEPTVAKAVVRASNRGVKVRALIDATSLRNHWSQHEALIAAGIPVKTDTFGGKIHIKTVSIDDILITGSMNWTKSGIRYNRENTWIGRSQQAVGEFKEYFDQIWYNESTFDLSIEPESIESMFSCMDGMDNDHDQRVDKADSGCL